MAQNTVHTKQNAEPPDFPLQRTCPFDPPAEYADLREQEKVIQVRVPSGQVAWLVTKFADVRRLLTDPRISADRFHPNMPLTEEVTPQTRKNIAAFGKSLIGLDPPDHGPPRRMLIPEFTVHRTQELRPHIQHTVDQCIDDLLSKPKPVDLSEVLSVPVPIRTLTELLGMPYEERPLIERAATQLRRSTSPEERQQTTVDLRASLARLIETKESNPGDDLLSRLIETNRETKLYDRDLMIGLAMLLVIAGFETTAAMISLGVTGLLQHPDQIAKLVEDPDHAGPAVEELLRYFTVVDAMPRVATGDIDVGDVTIRADEGVLLSFASANWDEEAFPSASTLDIDRGAKHHVAFGYGIHQCIGQNLAREELQIVYRTLFTRVPGIRLAVDLDDLRFKKDSHIYGLDALPVTW